MKNGQIQVVGVSSYEKDGRKSYTIHGISPFEDWESNNSIGMKVVNEWTNRVDLSEIKPGQIVQPIYGKGYQGKAIILDVAIVSEK